MLSHTPDVERPEPRWPVIIAACAAVALHFALPAALRPGTPWLLGIVVGTMVIAATVFRRLGMHRENAWASYGVLGALAVGLLYGVVALVVGLMRKTENATELLTSATVLWVTNVIVFASWYWRLDGGGPNVRERQDAHTRGAFLFPQMTMTRPWRRITLQLSQIFLTLGLTFMLSCFL